MLEVARQFIRQGMLFIILMAVLQISTASANDEYTQEVLYTVPWGNEPGMISAEWNENPGGIELFLYPPGPWAVSNNGEMVIAQNVINEIQLMKFAPDGTFVNRINLQQFGCLSAQACAILDDGTVLIGEGSRLFVLDTNLNLLLISEVHHSNAYITHIFPSNSGSFWIIYTTKTWRDGDIRHIDRSLVEFYLDGTMSEPQELHFSGTWEEMAELEKFVTPSGIMTQEIEDMYGNTYQFTGEEPGTHLIKKSPLGETLYIHDLYSDPGWDLWEGLGGVHHFVMWSGDFYTIHATSDGAVVTKYTLVE